MAKEVKAKYDYNSGHEDDLSFAAGQMITILEEVDDEWYNGEYHDTLGKRHQGMFPRNFVVLAPPQTVVPRLASIAKQEAAKDPVIKPKIPESAGSPNPSVKQAPITANSTSGKSVTSPPSSGVSLKSVGGIHTRETLASHEPVCYMSIVD
jgi:myosin tail region-interacting protein MTI1